MNNYEKEVEYHEYNPDIKIGTLVHIEDHHPGYHIITKVYLDCRFSNGNPIAEYVKVLKENGEECRRKKNTAHISIIHAVTQDTIDKAYEHDKKQIQEKYEKLTKKYEKLTKTLKITASLFSATVR